MGRMGNYGEHTETFIKARCEADCYRYAHEHGIPEDNIVFCRPVREGELYLMYIRGFHGKIIDWFCEPGNAPYPWGACMLYRGDKV